MPGLKKQLQNVLAQNSSTEIAYLCGKCGKEVAKEAWVCEHCGAKLGKIQCPFCCFTGTIEDFKFDTCPKCGRKTDKQKKKKSKEQKPVKESLLSHKLFWGLFFVLIVGISIILYIYYNFFL